LTLSLDVADMARDTSWPIHPASTLHCVIGAELGLDALRDSATNMKLEQHWDRLVVRRAAGDFGEAQLKLAEAAAQAIGQPPKGADDAWVTEEAKKWLTLAWAACARERVRPLLNSTGRDHGRSRS
jgi:NAD-specific glutamate dehydrogenase